MAVKGFNYKPQKFRFIAHYKDGKWDEGRLSEDSMLHISESSTALHYGQQCFEGLKAFASPSGKVSIFRPDLNAKRMSESCARVFMPEVPEELFLKGCNDVVKANIDLVPKYGDGSSLYIRPFVIGVGENLGVKPAPEYLFVVFVAPVGSYFADGFKPVKFCTTDYDRAAGKGTGKAKVGGNYAASLYPHNEAVKKGYADCIYLDPIKHENIEEVGAANFFGITKNNEFVTPTSPSILNSITKRSLMEIAKNELNLTVLERDCKVDNLDEFIETGACGTAAVITPISVIEHNGKEYRFTKDDVVGEKVNKLYELLTEIQFGKNEKYSHLLYEVK
ncbi:MAG: branched-chain amino acid aminotransferase [Bacilli bacterium]